VPPTLKQGHSYWLGKKELHHILHQDENKLGPIGHVVSIAQGGRQAGLGYDLDEKPPARPEGPSFALTRCLSMAHTDCDQKRL